MKDRINILAIVFCLSVIFLACSDDEGKTAGGVSVDEGLATIDNVTIAGVSQKGPFVTNTSVQLFGLNKDFIQDGTSFNGKVSSEAGEFMMQRVSLSVSYATLRINGYYHNEITGKISSSPVELRAVTDLSRRTAVNLNLLTHLEYDRVFALLDSDYTLAEAKKQSEREIFSAFFVNEKSENFENLNIFEQSSQNAALLGISVLLQSTLSEGELTDLLAHISSDVEADGVWDNDTLKAQIADRAFGLDLTEVRKNIESWKFGDVSQFEPYVRKFWRNVFGLPVCDTASEGKMVKVSNELSKYYGEFFVCHEKLWDSYTEIGYKMTLEEYSNLLLGQKGSGFDAWSYVKSGLVIKSNLGETGYWNITMEGNTTAVSESLVKDCGGICGTVISKSGENGSYVGVTAVLGNAGGDVTEWLGVCVGYESDAEITVVVRDAASKGVNPDENWPRYTLPRVLKDTVVNVPWGLFSPRGSLKNVVGLEMIVRGDSESAPAFSITQLGAYGTCE